MTRTICPQMAGIYKSNNNAFKFLLLEYNNPNAEYKATDAYPCDAYPCNEKLEIESGYESPIPFLAEDFGDLAYFFINNNLRSI